jgi:ubiquinone/menaquinone biosynthesis C-methylase UbiE
MRRPWREIFADLRRIWRNLPIAQEHINMSGTATSQPYTFDQSRFDHERLIRQARMVDVFAREACLRAGLRPGGRAIDVGCGPLGMLPVLAEQVGPGGTVVGLDMNADALRQAREVLDHLGYPAVKLVEAEINSLDPEVVAAYGPIDLAFCRLVLMYQVDPAATLRQIGTLVRPGGRILAADVLYDPHYPCYDPPVPAAERIMRLFFALVERKGGTVDIALRYDQLCERAGLRLLAQRGLFAVAKDPRDYLALYRDILLSMRENLLAQNLATVGEIDMLVQAMDAAQTTVRFGTLSLAVEMIAEVP